MEISGTIFKVLPLKSGVSQSSGKEWAVQAAVLQTPDLKYPKKMFFEIFGKERIEKADLHEGDNVNVSFDIDASEFNGKWYNSVKAYSVVKMEGFMKPEQAPKPKPTPQADPRVTTPSMFPDTPAEEPTNDLPF